MAEVVQNPVHLIHLPLRVAVLHPQLVAVGFADGTVLIRPLIPDVGVQIPNVVGFLLPNPQKFLHGGFPIGAPQGQDGEFLPQVVAVHNAEFLHGVGGGAVLPMGADLEIRVPHAAVQNIPAVPDKKFVSAAHALPPLWIIPSFNSISIPNPNKIV